MPQRTNEASASRNSADDALPVGPMVDDPSPRRRPERRAHVGVDFALEPFGGERHAGALFEASCGSPEREAIWTYVAGGPFASPLALGEWYDERGKGGDPTFFTVIERATERPAGIVSFLAIVPAHACVEIGHIWYAPEFQRSRANTEACYLLMRHAFDELGYRRVEWKCDALNARSRAAALRLGFTFEGIFRQHLIVRGRNRDTAWFSIVDGEWPRVRDAIERYLAWSESAGPRPSLGALTAAE